ncbi:MAG: SLBB domain-containing protein [Armatimonadetes bacterium]|nr:SLBB domain-containing protein [Armatimonadota bacterium]
MKVTKGERSTVLKQGLKELGVVGAGGAGFPTHVKASSKAEYVLANGAECEPLVHKDVEIIKHFPAEIVAGMSRMMEFTGASRGKFGIKEKNAAAIEALLPHIESGPIEPALLGDFYPSGDEYELVYMATGRLIPPAGIPIQVGCVVNNVETLYNVDQASLNIPVTRKFVSVTGLVNTPKSFWVPVGTTFRDLIQLAGGARAAEFGLFVGGLMMGRFSSDLDEVVTKTTAGLILLPADHFLVTRKNLPMQAMSRIGKSACDQCSYCTEFCPRYLLGYEVMPHKVMRSLGFTLSGGENWNQWSQLCCACGLCTLYACPEDLFPKEACDKAKTDMRAAGIKFVQKREVAVHPMKDARRVPLSMLRKRLKVDEYESEAPFEDIRFTPDSVRVLLSQHVGKPAVPIVSKGDKVKVGAAIARVGQDDLGADIHASIAGTVEAITDSYIGIRS